MDKLGLITSEVAAPLRNVALEEALLNAVVAGEQPPLLRLWRNESCVVMGANRKVGDDVYLDALREDGVPLVRRSSGGGTVYHDLENFNLSLVLKIDDTPGAETIPSSISLFCDWICAVLDGLGLNGEKTGISDVSVGGLKISGHAQARRKGCVLHHATILNRVDFERMSRYLKIPPERTGVEHRDFLTSLELLGRDLTFAEFRTISIEKTKRFFSPLDGCVKISNESLPDPGTLLKSRYAREDWTLRR